MTGRPFARAALIALPIIAHAGCTQSVAVEAPPDGSSDGANVQGPDHQLPQEDDATAVDSGTDDGSSDVSSPMDPDVSCSTGPDASAGIAHIVLTNTTSGTLDVEYSYGAPMWIHIGIPELPLVVFGPLICGIGGHDDPNFGGQWLDAGAQVTYDWDGRYMGETLGVTPDSGCGPCLGYLHVPPGSYPATACSGPAIWDGGYRLDAGSDDSGVRCVDVTVTLPASGQVTSSASW